MSWQEGVLGDLLVFQRGHDLPDYERMPGDVPVVGSAGVNGYHNFEKAPAPCVSIGRSGASIGKPFYLNAAYWPHNACLYVNDFKGNNPKYLFYLLGRMALDQFNSGAAQPSLNRNFLYGAKVRYPERAEQDRIVATLSTYDDLIENNQRRIALLEDAARQLYKEWFVRFRFPGHEHVEVIDGVPEGWERLKLGDVLTLQRGFDLPTANRLEGEIPVYGSTGIVGYHDTAKVVAPMIVTGRSGSLGQVCFVSTPCWPLNTALWVRDFKRVSPLHAYFLLLEMGLEKFNGGASVPTLDRKVAHAADLILPSQKFLDSFDETVKSIFALIDNLQLQINQLSKARDLLLPKLMNGTLTV